MESTTTPSGFATTSSGFATAPNGSATAPSFYMGSSVDPKSRIAAHRAGRMQYPKRTEQALALTPGSWAALSLEEATAALFDGATASMAAARAPTVAR